MSMRSKHSKVSNDTVILNVGGTHFTTCISTLTRYSTYFESMFSRHWSNHDNDNDEFSDEEEKQTRIIFIDKDPEPFKYLLSYMREGCIDIPSSSSTTSSPSSLTNERLAKLIILQAQYFGLEDFVQQCKARAWKNLNGENFSHSYDHDDDDEDNTAAVIKFDQHHGSLIDACDSGILPQALMGPIPNYITLYVSGTPFQISKSTLQTHSKFFKERIGINTTTDFLDHDPKAFEVLLTYMRYGQMDFPEKNPFLFQRILLLATSLQMNDFILLIKARTMVHLENYEAPMGLDPSFDSQDGIFMSEGCSSYGTSVISVTDVHRRYAGDFDRRFQDFEKAFEMRILPFRFFS